MKNNTLKLLSLLFLSSTIVACSAEDKKDVSADLTSKKSTSDLGQPAGYKPSKDREDKTESKEESDVDSAFEGLGNSGSDEDSKDELTAKEQAEYDDKAADRALEKYKADKQSDNAMVTALLEAQMLGSMMQGNSAVLEAAMNKGDKEDEDCDEQSATGTYAQKHDDWFDGVLKSIDAFQEKGLISTPESTPVVVEAEAEAEVEAEAEADDTTTEGTDEAAPQALPPVTVGDAVDLVVLRNNGTDPVIPGEQTGGRMQQSESKI